MVSRAAFHVFLLFVLTFLLHGAAAKPSFSLASKRSSSASSRAAAFEYNTNAKRMAAGLQPLSPTRVFDPSRIAPRSAPSPVSYSGFLRIYKASNSASLGWVTKNLHSSGRVMLSTSTSNRAPASFTYIDANTLIQISITTSSPIHPYLGASGATLQMDNNNRNNLVATTSVPSGSTPQNVGNSSGSGGSESFIWKYNIGTGEFTVWWTNPNGNQVAAYIYYEDTGANTGLHISANSNLPGGFDRVRLFYTS